LSELWRHPSAGLALLPMSSLATVVRMRTLAKIAPEPPEVTEGPVTEAWLRKFGIDSCIFDAKHSGVTETEVVKLHDEANKLAKQLYARLQDNGVFYVHQLESLSMHGQVNDVLQCVGVANTITESFDRKAAQDRKKKPIRNFIRSLAGNLAAMESMCVNYGLSAALVLTMTFANFGSVTNDDWRAYLARIELTNPRCQALAENACRADPMISLQSMRTENALAYWNPLYCQKALLDLVEDPSLNLSAPTGKFPGGRGCCVEALKCAVDASWNMELGFVIGCGGGTAVLLLVVMYTSWLYITLNATKVNRARWSEAKLLTKRLSNHFVVLQLLFVLGIILAYWGVYIVVGVKTTTYNLSTICVGIIALSAIIAAVIAAKILRDIHLINKKVDEDRRGNYSWSERAIEALRKDDRGASGQGDVKPF